MADHIPLIIVLALGAAVVGGPEALVRLLDISGKNPATDVTIAVFLIGAVTAFVLGTTLLAHYIRVTAVTNDVDAAAPLRQPGTARLVRVTLAVALAVEIFVAACLLAVPSVPVGAAERGLVGTPSSCSA